MTRACERSEKVTARREAEAVGIFTMPEIAVLF